MSTTIFTFAKRKEGLSPGMSEQVNSPRPLARSGLVVRPGQEIRQMSVTRATTPNQARVLVNILHLPPASVPTTYSQASRLIRTLWKQRADLKSLDKKEQNQIRAGQFIQQSGETVALPHTEKSQNRNETAVAQAYRDLPYAEYLETDWWKKLRAAAIARAGRRCQVCYSPLQLNVHHRTYERLGN